MPLGEDLPIFEEEDLPPARPDPVARGLLDQRTPGGKEIQLLAQRLVALGRDRRLRRLGVVSVRRGDGRSSVALGLATALADKERRVLLMEMDLSHPAFDHVFSWGSPPVGLHRYLADERLTALTLRRPGKAGLWVLSADPGQKGAVELLASSRLGPLLAAAGRVFDYVVADCPALASDPGVASLQSRLDGLVLVVREGRTTRDDVRQAVRLLKPEKLCGYVMNFSRRSPRG